MSHRNHIETADQYLLEVARGDGPTSQNSKTWKIGNYKFVKSNKNILTGLDLIMYIYQSHFFHYAHVYNQASVLRTPTGQLQFAEGKK